MRKVVVGGLICCLAGAVAVPWASAQDGSVVATGELYVRGTVFCLDGQEADYDDPGACDDPESEISVNRVEIEFPLDGSGRVTGAWELYAEYFFVYNGERTGFCLHDSGGELTGTYDPDTRTIDGDQLDQDVMQAFGIDDDTGECTREIEQPEFGDWDATFDGEAVYGTIWIDDGAGHEEAGGLAFNTVASVTGDIGTIPDGDAGPAFEDDDSDDAEYDPSTFDSIVEDMEGDDGGGVPVAAVAGGAAVLGGGAVAAARLRRARTRRTPPRERTEDDRPRREDPCAEQRAALDEVRARARTLNRGLQHFRTMDAQLEEAWLNARDAGFWSSTWDLASAGAGALAGTLGNVPTWLATDLLQDGILQAMVKSLGESMTRDFVIWLSTDRGADLDDWGGSAVDDAGKEWAKDRFPRFLTEKVGGGDAGFMERVAKPMADTLNNLGGLYKLGTTMSEASSVLEEIRKEQQSVRSDIRGYEEELEEAMADIELAQHALALCEKPAGAAMP